MKTLLATLLLLCHYGIATHSHAQASFFDPTFGVEGKTIVPLGPMSNGAFRSVAVQPDGKVVVCGFMAGKSVIARFKADGTADSSFAENGYYIHNGTYAVSLYQLKIQPDGKIVAAGDINLAIANFQFFFIRLTIDGIPDVAFGAGGTAIADFGTFSRSSAYSLALQPDGKVVIAGETTPRNAALVRLKADGSIDSSFGANGLVVGPYGDAQKVAIAPDGRIVIGGTASAAQNYALMTARYLENGMLDTTYNHTGIVYTIAGEARGNFGRALAVQPDGKIIIAGSGSFGTQGGNMVAVRYHINGIPDDWFGTGGIASIDLLGRDDLAYDMAIMPNGKIVLSGSSIGDSRVDIAVVRLKTNGTLDLTFGDGGKIINTIRGYNDNGLAVAVQPDNKILVAGNSYHAGYCIPIVVRFSPTTVGVSDITLSKNQPLLYPNPAQDIVFIDARYQSAISQILIFSTTGYQLPIHYIPAVSSIPLGHIPNGLYMVQFMFADGSTCMQRLVVQH